MSTMIQHFKHGLCIHVEVLFVSGVFLLVISLVVLGLLPLKTVAGLWVLSLCRKNVGPVFQIENVALQGVKPLKPVL